MVSFRLEASLNCSLLCDRDACQLCLFSFLKVGFPIQQSHLRYSSHICMEILAPDTLHLRTPALETPGCDHDFVEFLFFHGIAVLPCVDLL